MWISRESIGKTRNELRGFSRDRESFRFQTFFFSFSSSPDRITTIPSPHRRHQHNFPFLLFINKPFFLTSQAKRKRKKFSQKKSWFLALSTLAQSKRLASCSFACFLISVSLCLSASVSCLVLHDEPFRRLAFHFILIELAFSSLREKLENRSRVRFLAKQLNRDYPVRDDKQTKSGRRK